jgi:SEC-C motif-containing protein
LADTPDLGSGAERYAGSSPVLGKCPCYSGKNYADCCAPYHNGTPAPNALLLMRSRYSAFSLGLADYLVATSLPPQDKASLLTFSRTMTFTGLDILEFVDGATHASVTFRAHLLYEGKDSSFTEKSAFIKQNNRWHYVNADR